MTQTLVLEIKTSLQGICRLSHNDTLDLCDHLKQQGPSDSRVTRTCNVTKQIPSSACPSNSRSLANGRRVLNENGHAVAIESKIDIQSRTKAAITATAEKFSDTMASTGEQNITIGNNTVSAISMVTPTSEPSAFPSNDPSS